MSVGGSCRDANPAHSDQANFINFCSGETLTNGIQNKAGSCNGIGRCTTGLVASLDPG